ncbi:acetyl-CoA acetyltransferase [Skermanella aerolata]|uniref:Acetyl-CoA acetyltransferase n=1 Tax=Skermanella aerolata TaxID=393310 RepID=A0A512DZQ1_9PROT|nr:thiolase family protein [Skermanella aerolata]KJB91978.1 acetyl-CoA acetyltransferase [Skermanella aerolata KACC 11604]GEO41922.1 acetyl-CoA acetyltransferase [Skermanella aerolata]
MKNVVIAGYVRSPFHFANKGKLARIRPDDLAAQVVNGLLKQTGVDPNEIEDIMLGCAFPEGEQGFNVAKLVGMLANLPQSVAGTTINRFCGSSMQAIHMAAGAIQMDAGHAFIAGGIESMSRVPMMGFNPMPNPKLAESNPGAYMAMGITAENLATKYQFTREAQEAVAVESHRKAAEAQASGRFDDEIVAIKTPDGVVDKDGCIRADTTPQSLAALKAAFLAEGTVTAGTASPLTDGSSATLVTSEEFARAHGLPILARIKSIAVSGCDPTIMGYGPVPSTQKALKRAGITVKDLDIVESNEAFAVQAMTVAQELGFDGAKVNLDGGALALGHPLGATGARITGKAAQLLKREGGQFALSTQCIGGGQGIATVLEAV